MNKERLLYIDCMKAIAAFMVAIYHFSECKFFDFGYSINSEYIPGFGKILLGLCCSSVPLFFLCNGITTSAKSYSLRKTVSKLLNIVKVYIFWGYNCSTFKY
jgi:surface polysaccharide O-acyltransferase-like enzyme